MGTPLWSPVMDDSGHGPLWWREGLSCTLAPQALVAADLPPKHTCFELVLLARVLLLPQILQRLGLPQAEG